jgi:hypothetical protein
MRLYQFATYGEDASSPVDTKTATLPDDSSAWDYGETIVRDLLRSDPQERESRLMVVSCGERIIASIGRQRSGQYRALEDRATGRGRQLGDTQ